jgi:hypothetical protein
LARQHQPLRRIRSPRRRRDETTSWANEAGGRGWSQGAGRSRSQRLDSPRHCSSSRSPRTH